MRPSPYGRGHTKNNLPAQIELYAGPTSDAYSSSSCKERRLGQQELPVPRDEGRAEPARLMRFLDREVAHAGAPRPVPPITAVVIGGPSAEYCLKVAKYASAKYSTRADVGNELGRGSVMSSRQEVLALSQQFGIGRAVRPASTSVTTFGYRLPRHGASARRIAVSCSADRQRSQDTAEGVFLEKLGARPARFAARGADDDLSEHVVRHRPRSSDDEDPGRGSKHPVKTRVRLSGPMVVARDIAHAKIKDDSMPASRCRRTSGPLRLLRGPGQDAGGLRVGLRSVRTTRGRMDS